MLEALAPSVTRIRAQMAAIRALVGGRHGSHRAKMLFNGLVQELIA